MGEVPSRREGGREVWWRAADCAEWEEKGAPVIITMGAHLFARTQGDEKGMAASSVRERAAETAARRGGGVRYEQQQRRRQRHGSSQRSYVGIPRSAAVCVHWPPWRVVREGEGV